MLWKSASIFQLSEQKKVCYNIQIIIYHKFVRKIVIWLAKAPQTSAVYVTCHLYYVLM